jgi:hypothetical protein
MASLLATAVVVTAAGPTFAAGPADGITVRSAGIDAGLRPGDRVVDHGVSVLVPRPGQSVWAAVEFADGTNQELEVVTGTDGAIRLVHWGDDAIVPDIHVDPGFDTAAMGISAEAQARRGSRAECRTTAHSLFRWRIPSYRWFYSARTTPRKFRVRRNGVRQVVDSLIRANRAVVSARNVCGRADRVGARFTYKGLTSRRPGGSGTSCGGGDGRSVIGWGALPGYAIAFMCVHGAREADVRISNRQPYETTRRRCGGEFLIEAPMAHEFGHVYGLGHVRPESQTMNSFVSWCSTAELSLGLGDLRGLERKY